MENYTCAMTTENNEGCIILYKILQKNQRTQRRNKLLQGHL